MNEQITIFTIGFTKKSAKEFFSKLREAGVKRLIDVRLNNASQLAGFTKRDDLEFFLQEIADIGYVHLPELAPTKDILDEYKRKRIDWNTYEAGFSRLMDSRRIEDLVSPELLNYACLLCSEPTPEHCHRRLVAEYLQARWDSVLIRHIT